MDYNGEARPGDFHAGYQEIEGINLGYLQINGTQMFALAQVLSDLFKDIPRTTISKKMETLKIKSRRCDLKELRTLKAINSVPTRAVKCSLISKADLEALCTSCKSLSPRRRKRKRKKPVPGSVPQPPAQEPPGNLDPSPAGETGEPRREHFDRLIRQSKLWCYAKGFNLDGKSLRAGPTPPRNSFSLMGNFPCIPSLVVGEDGDLCPASSLGVKNSWVLSKTHPLWSWHLGGNAPVPPSLKFRGYSLEDL
ncbi:hypothetical protein A306_00013235 [Columba livia]|uniref:SKI/SNO/DAC domain-containing protein n=1 Tax=Columba livia TaxID=8932 RepID=A0A2I0LN58_COLLI|nr:hypothetical protein A306_00013235 [Columba livia]